MKIKRVRSPVSMELPPRPVARSPPRLELGFSLCCSGPRGLYCPPATNSFPATDRVLWVSVTHSQDHEMQLQSSCLLPGDQGASGASDAAEGPHRD